MEDDAYAGCPKIERWEVLKKELKDQFLTCKTAWVARDSLNKLKHTGTVREYVKELSSLMLDIKNIMRRTSSSISCQVSHQTLPQRQR